METEELLVKLEAAGNDLKKIRNILQQVNFTIVSNPRFLLSLDFLNDISVGQHNASIV